MKLVLIAVVTGAAMLSGCATQSHTFAVGGREILGADFILCDSKIKWQGVDLTIEGLKVDPTAVATTRSFSVAKFGAKEEQIHQLQNIALALDSNFTKWCGDAIMLKRHPDQLEKYLSETSDKAERMFSLLTDLEKINLQAKSSDEALAQQKAAYDAAKPAPAPTAK
jgi:hypothetical protein